MENFLFLVFIILCIFYLFCRSKKSKSEGFGMDNRPFEEDNSLLHRNVWDEVDYIRPELII